MRAVSLRLAAAVLALCIVPASHAGIPDWYVESIPHDPNSFLNPALEYSSTNLPNIAYFDDGMNLLLWAVKQGGVWHVDTIINVVAREHVFALTSTDLPQIAYRQFLQRLKYTFYTGSNWIDETIVNSDVGDRLSLVMGPGDAPQLAYRDVPDNRIRLARRGPGGWTGETIDSSGAGFRDVSLAVDASGNPHVVYVQNSPFRMKYATKSGGVWSYETIDSTGTPTIYPRSLALDVAGVPHVAYLEGGNGDLAYANRLGGVWSSEIAEPGIASIVGHFATLALAPDGTPHIGHQKQDTEDMLYTTRSGILWTTVPVAEAGEVGRYSQIARAPNGDLGAVWYNNTNQSVDYAVALLSVGVEAQSAPVMQLRVHPNPSFAGNARLNFTLTSAASVRLAIHDAQGREVRVLANRVFAAGHSELKWDGRSTSGRIVEPGIYFVRLELDGETRGRSRIAIVR